MNSASMRSRSRRSTQQRRCSKTGNVMIRFAVLAITMILLNAAATPIARAQTYTVLYNFSPGTKNGDPSSPQYTGIIAQGQDGNLHSLWFLWRGIQDDTFGHAHPCFRLQ